MNTLIRTFIKKTHINHAILQNNTTYSILTKYIDNQNFLTYKESIQLLNRISAKPNSSSIVAQRAMRSSKYNLKIIIPVYNSEKYIDRCLQSVCKQKSKYKIQIQIINDGSTDDSIQIISKYNDKRICVVSQKNKGFSEARNAALHVLDSDYIMFLDSDDTLTENSVQSLLESAYANDADIVEGGFNRIVCGRNIKGVVHRNLQNVKIDELYGFPWGKIIKTKLFNKVQFPEGYWFEDSIMSFLIYPMAKNKVTISDIVYNYRYNLSGISVRSRYNLKCIDTLWITKLMLNEVNKLKIEKNNGLLNIFMAQIILNFRRTNNMNSDVKKAIFVCTVHLLKKELAKFTPSKEFNDLYNAILNGNYNKYYILCSLS